MGMNFSSLTGLGDLGYDPGMSAPSVSPQNRSSSNWLSGLMGYVNPIAGGISAISGLLGGMDEKRRQQALMQQAISRYGQGIDSQNNNAMGQQLQALYSGTGVGNDSVRNSGMALGDALGRSGVYNSSALAGALSNQSIGNAANVAGMYASMDAARKQQYAQGQQNLANMQLGVSMPMFYNAQNQLAGSASGLQQWLQGLSQQGNQQSGVTDQMNNLGPNNGNAGKGVMSNPFVASQNGMFGGNASNMNMGNNGYYNPYAGSMSAGMNTPGWMGANAPQTNVGRFKLSNGYMETGG